MRQFLSPEALAMKPYTPGEQPRDQQYTKLNTNESPFPPSPKVVEVVSRAQVGMLNLYSDPTCKVLEDAIAVFYGVESENVTSGNGSDEVLAFAFRAFAGEGKPIAYADITYGCYKTWAALFGIESKVIPLREDFTVNVDDYMDFPGTIVIANPNAPTGMLLPVGATSAAFWRQIPAAWSSSTRPMSTLAARVWRLSSRSMRICWWFRPCPKTAISPAPVWAMPWAAPLSSPASTG